MSFEKEKQVAAEEAVKLVKNHMVIGVGTGSTAGYLIPALIEHMQKHNLTLSCICTSKRSQELINNRIPLIDNMLTKTIDITFDGADRVSTRSLNLIKGGGGALLREKLVACNSKQNVVLVDPSKLVPDLQGFPVPIEIASFGAMSTIKRLENLGYRGHLRHDPQGILFITDNHNFIYDITFQEPIKDPEFHHTRLKATLGVVETGFFIHTASMVYVGHPDGTVQILRNKRIDS